MSLRDVMAFIQTSQGGALLQPRATPLKPQGLQPKPAWIGACTPATPETPRFDNAQAHASIARSGAAANDPSASVTNPPAPTPQAVDWRALDAAYQAHHAHCHVCQAAGRGTRYGLRCGVGASLWSDYTAAITQHGALPWQQKEKK